MKRSPQSIQRLACLFSTFRNHPIGFGGVASQAVYPIRPIAIIGAFLSLHFDMPFDRRVCVFDEGGFPIRKVEAVAFALPVALFAPRATFAGVLSFRPLG